MNVVNLLNALFGNRFSVDAIIADITSKVAKLDEAQQFHEQAAAQHQAEAARYGDMATAAAQEGIRAQRLKGKIAALIS